MPERAPRPLPVEETCPLTYDDDPTAVITPREWDLPQLEVRANALVREALAKWSDKVRFIHWPDMKQTAVAAFLEYQDQPMNYAYKVAQIALKNYVWIHIRGLNGGWKAQVARDYYLVDDPLPADDDCQITTTSSYQLFPKPVETEPYELIPRPVERTALAHLDHESEEQPLEQTCREVLTILAGMAGSQWYPEKLYRAARIIALRGHNYLWEEVAQQVDLPRQRTSETYWHYRQTFLTPYIKMTPLHQAIIQVRGMTRLFYFEELSPQQLNHASRKMVVVPHGIYTIIYSRRGQPYTDVLDGSLHKGRSFNGRAYRRSMSLGKVGHLTKERLWEATFCLDEKLAALANKR